MFPLRLLSLTFSCALAAFALAFVVGRAERPATAETGAVPRLPTLPAPATPPAISELSRAAALPRIKIRHAHRPTRTTSAGTTATTTVTPTDAATPTTTSRGPATGVVKPNVVKPATKTKTKPGGTGSGGSDVSDTGDSLGG